MAKTNTYQPSAELQELLRRYLAGDRSKETLDALRTAMATDTRFKSYFNTMTSSRTLNLGRGENWRIGTNGASVGGGEMTIPALGRSTAGASAWNQYRMSRGGYGNSPTSPGGFKSSGRDEDSALRRSGLVSGERARNAVKFTEDGRGVRVGNRTYSKTEVDAILARGLSGATMNWKDQAIYDVLGAYGGTFDEAKSARMEEMRRSARDPDETAVAEASRLRLEDAADILKRSRDFEDWRRKEDYKKQLESKDLEFERLNEKHGLPRGTRLSQKDYDALESGAKVYDRDADTKAKYERDRREIEDKFFNREIDENAYNYALDALEAEYAKTPMRLVDNTAPKTVEQILASAQNGLYTNGNGDLIAVPDTFENKQNQRAEEARQKRQDRLDDIAEKRRLERNKWVAEQTLKQQAAHEKARAAAEKAFGEDLKNDGKEFSYPDFDELAMRRRLFDLYDATERGAETQVPEDNEEAVFPQIVEDTPLPQPDPVADKWAHRAMGGGANGAPAPTEDEMLTPQSPDEFVPGGNCPVCGSQLDEFGNCNVCGWPDEEMAAQWKIENGIE